MGFEEDFIWRPGEYGRAGQYFFDGRMYSDMFTGVPHSPPRPKIEIIEVRVNGMTYAVPLNNQEVDALIARGKKYAADEERKQNQRREDERQRKARQHDEWRKAQQDWERLNESLRNSGFGRGAYNFTFSGTDDGFRSPPRSSTGSSPRTKASAIEQLIELAEVSILEAKGLTHKQLYRRAQRKCHPDSGGSHEKWLRLEALVVYLDLN